MSPIVRRSQSLHGRITGGLAVALLLLIAFGHCTHADDETLYAGKTLNQWIVDLGSNDPQVRLLAAWAVGSIGPDAAPAVPALIELLGDADPVTRLQACSALANIGPAAGPAEQRLRELLHDPNAEVRGYAQMALMEIGGSTTPAGGVGPIDPTQPLTEPDVPPDEPGPTEFLQPLRNHHANLQAITAELAAIAATCPDGEDEAQAWLESLRAGGRKLIAESKGFVTTLHSFVTARTRRGLGEEADLIEACIEQMINAGEQIEKRTAFDVDAWAEEQKLRAEAAKARAELIKELAEELDRKLETEGLLVLLAEGGVQALRAEAVSRIRTSAESELDRITEQELGLRFHDAKSLRESLRQKARELARRKVQQLLFKVTSNQVLVTFLGDTIIDWLEGTLWPRLREAFRNKGDLDFRTQRSVGTLDAARMRLWALPDTASLDDVRAAMRNADGAVGATRYLMGDLQRAGRQDLLGQMQQAGSALVRAKSITEKRFLLHRADVIEKAAGREEAVRGLLRVIEAMVAAIGEPEEEQPEVAGKIWYLEYFQQPSADGPIPLEPLRVNGNRTRALVPVRLMYVNAERMTQLREQFAREGNQDAQLDFDEFVEKYRLKNRYQKDYRYSVTMNGRTHHAMFPFNADRPYHWGSGEFVGVPAGQHSASVSLETIEGDRADFEVHFVIEIDAEEQRKELERLARERQDLEASRARLAAAQGDAVRQAANDHIRVLQRVIKIEWEWNAAGPDELLALVTEIRQAAERILAAGDAGGYAFWCTSLLDWCQMIGTEAAYSLAEQCVAGAKGQFAAAAAQASNPEMKRASNARALQTAYVRLANMKMALTDDIDATRLHLEQALIWQKVADPAVNPDAERRWWPSWEPAQ